MVKSVKNTQWLIDDYKQGIVDRLKPKLYELQNEGDSKISLATEKCNALNKMTRPRLRSLCISRPRIKIKTPFPVSEALSNIKKADGKLTSLSNAAMQRKATFDRWNDTLASKLQNLKDKIAEARNTADGVTTITGSLFSHRFYYDKFGPNSLLVSSFRTYVVSRPEL